MRRPSKDIDKRTSSAKDLHLLEEALVYSFKDKSFIESACHHKSAHLRKRNLVFERLEFLGDRVLGLAMAELLFAKYAKEDEGDLAKRLALLVSKECCLKIAEKISLHTYIKANKEDLTPQSNILSDAMEALLGAIFLDGGFSAAKKAIAHLWESLLNENEKPPRDPKTALQEYAQGVYKCVPIYTLLERKGPDHAPIFTLKVFVEGLGEEMGQGITKRQAEQNAAQKLLKAKKINIS